MRTKVVGATVFAGLVVATMLAALLPQAIFAERMAPPPASGEGLITMAIPLGEHKQQITVIDPHTRTMAVYHVDGEITLKSVRNIHYDLQMFDFNGTKPSSREVRAMVDQK